MISTEDIKAKAEAYYNELYPGAPWPLSLLVNDQKDRRVFIAAFTLGYCDGAEHGIDLVQRPARDLIEAYKNLSRLNAGGAN